MPRGSFILKTRGPFIDFGPGDFGRAPPTSPLALSTGTSSGILEEGESARRGGGGGVNQLQPDSNSHGQNKLTRRGPGRDGESGSGCRTAWIGWVWTGCMDQFHRYWGTKPAPAGGSWRRRLSWAGAVVAAAPVSVSGCTETRALLSCPSTTRHLNHTPPPPPPPLRRDPRCKTKHGAGPFRPVRRPVSC